MALKDKWKDLVDGVSELWADVINSIAHGVIKNEEDIEVLETPASETLEETTLEQLDTTSYGYGSISGNTYSARDYVYSLDIKISGRVYFDVAENDNTVIYIDGNKYEADTFDGYVSERISLGPASEASFSITFGTIKIGKYTGGILSDEQAEKLISGEKYTTSEKKKLNDTQVYTSDEKSALAKLRNTPNASYTKYTSLIDLKNKGILVTDATVGENTLTGGITATISPVGYIRFSFIVPSGEYRIFIDGVRNNVLTNQIFSYDGYANEIKFEYGGLFNITFDEFELYASTTDGYMTGLQAGAIARFDAIGDAGYTLVDKTLVELQNEGLLIADETTTVENSALTGGTEVTINVGGDMVYFKVRKRTPYTTKVFVDGVDISENNTVEYEGYVDVIKIIDESSIDLFSVSVKLLSEYNGGYMTGERVKDIEKAKADIEALKANVGNIGAVFDEVHEYAETLIGGDEE